VDVDRGGVGCPSERGPGGATQMSVYAGHDDSMQSVGTPDRAPRRFILLVAAMALVGALEYACVPGPRLLISLGPGSNGCAAITDLPQVPTWSTPIGVAGGMYFNQAPTPVTLVSVSLIDPHGLVLHDAVLYSAGKPEHVLPAYASWSSKDWDELAPGWAGRQRIPGATIPAGRPTDPADPGHLESGDMYETDLQITATTPSGGWARGERLTYRAYGLMHTVETHAMIVLAARCEQP
jgi:hypothetical protein